MYKLFPKVGRLLREVWKGQKVQGGLVEGQEGSRLKFTIFIELRSTRSFI